MNLPGGLGEKHDGVCLARLQILHKGSYCTVIIEEGSG